MFLINAFGIICLLVTLHLSNGYVNGYGSSDSDEKIEKVGTWIKANQDEIVRYHNEVRRKVFPLASDMMKMVWNDDAFRNSEAVAKKCNDIHSHPSKRVIKKPYVTTCGENIYVSSAMDSWKEVIYDWFSEKEHFTYGKGRKTPKAMIGHYTQAVWASSSMVGCYYQKCDNLELRHLYFCQYCPAGNMEDLMKTPYSSGKPCSKCKGKCEDKLCV